MRLGHADDSESILYELVGEGAAAVLGDIEANFFEGGDGVGADGVAIAAGDAGGNHFDRAERLGLGGEGVLKEGGGHRATADVGGTDDEDVAGLGHRGGMVRRERTGFFHEKQPVRVDVLNLSQSDEGAVEVDGALKYGVD